MLLDIRPDHLQIVQAILQKHIPEYEVWAFGSRAKWKAKEYSDLDLCVITKEPLSFTILGLMAEDFSESDLPWKVDVVDWSTTKESFQKIIEKDKIVIQKGVKKRGAMPLGMQKIVDRVSDSACAREGITRQTVAESEANVGLRSAYPTYAIEITERTLEDCLYALIDYRGKTPKKTDFGIPLITAKIIKNGRIEKPTEFIAADQYDSWMRRGIPIAGDVVLTMEAPLGEVAQLGSEKIALAQRVVTLRGKTGVLDNTYLLYTLQTEEMQEQLKSRATGTTVLGIKQSELRKIRLKLPSITTQISAASTLKALDDRIALLRETNITLEAIAQALFKSWFVDFDPVRAKQQGCEPEGMDTETAALFPDSFEESELGLVPSGWHLLSFTDTVKVIGGGTPKTSMPEYWGGDIPWFSVFDAPAITDVFVIDTAKHISLEGLNNSSTKLLPEGTTIISARGTVGRLALVGREMAMNQSCYGLRGKADDAYFTYFSTYRLVESLKQRSHGSVFDTITTETMKGIYVIYPDTSVIHAFETVLCSVMNRIKTNLEQAQTLATLRDTLLPRLISGQLLLPEASPGLV